MAKELKVKIQWLETDEMGDAVNEVLKAIWSTALNNGFDSIYISVVREGPSGSEFVDGTFFKPQ